MERMTSSIRLGRILGIPVGLHWGALLIAAAFAVSLATSALVSLAPGTSLGVRLGVATAGVVVFFASILAHEIGHAVVALHHGIGVSSITLWVLGGMARLERQPPTARAELRIAAAGPAVSLLLGAFFTSLSIIVAASASTRVTVVILGWLGGVNLLLGVFNLLPAAPLDGGRILTAILWRRSDDPDRARIIAGRCGLVLSLILIVTGTYLMVFADLVNGATNLAVGALIYFAAAAEISSAALRRRLASTTVADLHTPHPPPINDGVTISQFLHWAGADGRATAYPVVRWDHHPVGYVVPDWAASLSEPEQAWTSVGALMVRADQVVTATVTEPIEDVIDRLGDGRSVLQTHDPDTATTVGTLTDRQIRPLLAAPSLWGTDRRPRMG